MHDFSNAIASYTKAIAEDPEYTKAYYNRANAKMNLKNYKGAIQDFSKVVVLDPEFAKAYLYMGYAYYKQKNYDQASEAYSHAIKVDPSMGQAYTNRAAIYMKAKNYKQAIADLDRALDLDDSDAMAFYNRGVCHSNLDQYYDAINDLTLAVDMDPTLESCYRVRAKCFLNIEKYNQAISDLSLIIKDEPTAQNYYLRGYAYQMKSDLNNALRDFDTALAMDPDLDAALKNLAMVAFNLEEYEKAEIAYNRLSRKYPDEANYPMQKGVSNLKLKKYEQAADDFSDAIKINKSLAEAYYNRSNAYAQLELFGKACDDMRYAAKMGFDPAFDHIRSLCEQ